MPRLHGADVPGSIKHILAPSTSVIEASKRIVNGLGLGDLLNTFDGRKQWRQTPKLESCGKLSIQMTLLG